MHVDRPHSRSRSDQPLAGTRAGPGSCRDREREFLGREAATGRPLSLSDQLPVRPWGRSRRSDRRIGARRPGRDRAEALDVIRIPPTRAPQGPINASKKKHHAVRPLLQPDDGRIRMAAEPGSAAGRPRALAAVHERDGRGRRAAGRQPAGPAVDRDHRSHPCRRAPHPGRAFRRHPGNGIGLCGHRGSLARECAEMGRDGSEHGSRQHRGPSDSSPPQ